MPPTRDLGFIHKFVPAQSGSSHPVTLLLLHGTGSDFRRIATILFASVGDAAAHIWGNLGRNDPCGSFSRATDRQTSNSGLTPTKLAVQERYNQKMRLSVPSCSLQGIAERPLPCKYNVIQLVIALSRRKRGFKSRRGRHLFNDLQILESPTSSTSVTSWVSWGRRSRSRTQYLRGFRRWLHI
jgi:hypothetical protein